MLVGVVLLGLVGALFEARALSPCWRSARTATLSLADCRETLTLGDEASGDPSAFLRHAEALWSRGVHPDWLPPLAATVATRATQHAQALTWVRRSAEGGGFEARYFEAAKELAPLREDPHFADALHQVASSPLLQSVGEGLRPQVDAGFDAAALDALLERATQTKTSALVLVKDGALAGEWYFEDGPARTEMMSATKAITGLSVALLVRDGLLSGPDAPLSEVFPEWAEGRKAQVTFRHVLTHTSGLDAWRSVLDFIWRDDFVQAARDAKLVTAPGEVEFYNNKAVNLLVGAVKAKTGKPLDAWLDERLFAPMGLRDWDWLHDPSGNPHGMSGLRLHPRDLAKLGVLLADDGRWQGAQLLPAGWVAQATQPSVKAAPSWGFLFAVHPRQSTVTLDAAAEASLSKAGATGEELTSLRTALGTGPVDASIFSAEAISRLGVDRVLALREAGGFPRAQRTGEGVGFSAVGSGGIFLTVFPAEHLVAVRMSASDGQDGAYEFVDFPARVRALLPSLAP